MQCSSIGCSLAQWKDICPWRPIFGPKGKFWGVNKKQRSCDGRVARSAPFGLVMSPKRRVRAAHGRARAAKTHYIIYLSRVLCLSYSCRPVIFLSSCHPVCRSCGTRSYSLCFSNQINQGDETEGFEMEGLEILR